MNEGIGGENFSCSAIKHIDVAVAFGANEDFACLTIDGHVQKYLFVDAVVIVQVVWSQLIEPARVTVVRVACKDSAGPLVIARSLVWIPWAWVRCAVEN